MENHLLTLQVNLPLIPKLNRHTIRTHKALSDRNIPRDHNNMPNDLLLLNNNTVNQRDLLTNLSNMNKLQAMQHNDNLLSTVQPRQEKSLHTNALILDQIEHQNELTLHTDPKQLLVLMKNPGAGLLLLEDKNRQ